MAGLLAWAADVVGGSGQSNEEEEEDDEKKEFPAVKFTAEQQKYARELEVRAASLKRSIQDLRLRIPPPDISQRLPHLHAHSLASNADLALQLNAHIATREQALLRETTLQEENVAYERSISSCEKKIQEKLQEADQLQAKLKEMDTIEKCLRSELEKMQATSDVNHFTESLTGTNTAREAQVDAASRSITLEKLDTKKKELSSMEETVQDLEKKWALIQHNSLRQPSPAQREKILDKQLHSLIEQLAGKQAQAENLAGEIHIKKQELEKLNLFQRDLENENTEANAARNRFGKSSSGSRSSSTDYVADTHLRPSYVGGRTESQHRLMLFRSAFVLYILALHVLVFIKISF